MSYAVLEIWTFDRLCCLLMISPVACIVVSIQFTVVLSAMVNGRKYEAQGIAKLKSCGSGLAVMLM